jgi:hypothetical protein
MIWGIALVLTTIWVYQSARKEKTENLMYWVAGCALVFLGVVFLFVLIDISILEAFRSSESNPGYEPDLTDIGDRKNEGGFQGFKGVFLSTFSELMPAVAGFLVVAVIRAKFILKAALTPANLFSGIGETFSAIGNSFKAAAKEE